MPPRVQEVKDNVVIAIPIFGNEFKEIQVLMVQIRKLKRSEDKCRTHLEHHMFKAGTRERINTPIQIGEIWRKTRRSNSIRKLKGNKGKDPKTSKDKVINKKLLIKRKTPQDKSAIIKK